tara:strand:- start:176 stop:418 length:243 start_codon:yes stop_codon:yes gene_type:complete
MGEWDRGSDDKGVQLFFLIMIALSLLYFGYYLALLIIVVAMGGLYLILIFIPGMERIVTALIVILFFGISISGIFLYNLI